MDDRRLERIEQKLDDVTEHLNSIDNTLASQHEVLKEHIRRTLALEKKLVPVEKHVTGVQSIARFLTVLGVILTIVSTILHLYKVI